GGRRISKEKAAADDSALGGHAADRGGGVQLRLVFRRAPPIGRGRRRAGSSCTADSGVIAHCEPVYGDRIRAAVLLSGSGARSTRRDSRARSLSRAAVCRGADAAAAP